MAILTLAGMALTIASRAPITVMTMNSRPDIKTMASAHWYCSTTLSSFPVTRTMAGITVKAKKALRPMPEACAKGILAKNAMSMVPMKAERQVAKKTPL